MNYKDLHEGMNVVLLDDRVMEFGEEDFKNVSAGEHVRVVAFFSSKSGLDYCGAAWEFAVVEYLHPEWDICGHAIIGLHMIEKLS